jgi:DNA invertase Pin-like site-specific DNA recombinase
MRAAIYARVSTRDKQDAENQLAQLRQFLTASGYTPTGEYVDHESGARPDRPAFLAMLEDARRRRFDVLLFWSLDRLSREGVFETLRHLQQLTAAGVKWRSYTEQYLDTCGVFADAVIAILAAIARQERIRLSERTRAGMERARRNGVAIGRPAADRGAICALAASGLARKEIARRAGVSAATVSRALRTNHPTA